MMGGGDVECGGGVVAVADAVSELKESVDQAASVEAGDEDGWGVVVGLVGSGDECDGFGFGDGWEVGEGFCEGAVVEGDEDGKGRVGVGRGNGFG